MMRRKSAAGTKAGFLKGLLTLWRIGVLGKAAPSLRSSQASDSYALTDSSSSYPPAKTGDITLIIINSNSTGGSYERY